MDVFHVFQIVQMVPKSYNASHYFCDIGISPNNRPIKFGIKSGDYKLYNEHCVKSIHIRSFSGPYFPTFAPNNRPI